MALSINTAQYMDMPHVWGNFIILGISEIIQIQCIFVIGLGDTFIFMT